MPNLATLQRQLEQKWKEEVLGLIATVAALVAVVVVVLFSISLVQ
jgi:hypothetical protein